VAFGKFINPTLNGEHATRRVLRPSKRFWVSFCYDSPTTFASQRVRDVGRVGDERLFAAGLQEPDK